MKVCFIPIDNRPVCYNLAKDIAAIDSDIELFVPPREYLGDLTKCADIDKLFSWLKNVPICDSIIVSLDTLAYGGLIPSRRGEETFEEIRNRISFLKGILKEKKAKIYAFSSIMRISNNNYNEEEKEYWSEYGKKIFKYSFDFHKNGHADLNGIPKEILEDYLSTRKRNFEINKIYLEWQKEGLFETLIFSKDDCAEYGLNVKEALELEALGGYTKTGADEIPLTLLARSFEKDIKVFVEYTEPDCKHLISNYEDVSIEKSVQGQLELGGFKQVQSIDEADLVLLVNNFRDKQGELVMGWETGSISGEKFDIPPKPYAAADVRYANGADNGFVKQLLLNINDNFCGYAGWNTSANTLGSLLAALKVKYKAKKYNDMEFKKLQVVRFLDDWAYQANVRGQIEKPCDISELMKPYEDTLCGIFGYNPKKPVKYIYPWNRKFEIEVVI